MFKTDIAFKTETNKGFLPFISSFMVFIACIIFASNLIVNNITTEWNGYLNNNITIQILPNIEDKDPQQEIETRILKITEILKSTAGIKSYSVVSKNDAIKTLTPYLGNINNDFLIPRMITIETSPVIPLNTNELKENLKTYSQNIKFTTYNSWMIDLQKSISGVQSLLFFIVAIILIATGLTISFATKSGLHVNKQVIEITHLFGATNKYIATSFSRQMMLITTIGGIIGYIIACIVIFGIKNSAPIITNQVIMNLNFSNKIYIYLLIIPILASIITKISAFITIHKELES